VVGVVGVLGEVGAAGVLATAGGIASDGVAPAGASDAEDELLDPPPQAASSASVKLATQVQSAACRRRLDCCDRRGQSWGMVFGAVDISLSQR